MNSYVAWDAHTADSGAGLIVPRFAGIVGPDVAADTPGSDGILGSVALVQSTDHLAISAVLEAEEQDMTSPHTGAFGHRRKLMCPYKISKVETSGGSETCQLSYRVHCQS